MCYSAGKSEKGDVKVSDEMLTGVGTKARWDNQRKLQDSLSSCLSTASAKHWHPAETASSRKEMHSGHLKTRWTEEDHVCQRKKGWPREGARGPRRGLQKASLPSEPAFMSRLDTNGDTVTSVT